MQHSSFNFCDKILSPSILAYDNCKMSDGVRLVESFKAEWLHVDVMDGSFVPNITFGQSFVKDLKKMTDLVLDVHLMVCEPLGLIKSFVDAGADILTVHYESGSNIENSLMLIKNLGSNVGLAIKPETSVWEIKKYLHLLDLVLVMSVEPGKCGQKFLQSACSKLETLKALRKMFSLNYKISVDGGINADTLPIAYDAGAEVFVAGSAFFSNCEQFRKFF